MPTTHTPPEKKGKTLEPTFHSTCHTCGKMIPNNHFDCEREHYANLPAHNDDIPMGVSQWDAHGKRYGYPGYFQDRIARIEGEKEELLIALGDAMDFIEDCAPAHGEYVLERITPIIAKHTTSSPQ